MRSRTGAMRDHGSTLPEDRFGIKAFFGTGRVMFIAEGPSTRGGELPSSCDVEFYKLLREYDLADSHLTDLVKCRGLVEKQED